MSIVVKDKLTSIVNRQGIASNKILNIDIFSLTSAELLEYLQFGMLVTINVDILIRLQHDAEFYNLVKRAEWVVCDSRILCLAARFLGTPFKDVIPGSSFFPLYYNHHRDNLDVSMFLLGAQEGVAEKAAKSINAKVGRQMVVNTYSPPMNFEDDLAESEHIVNIINNSGATVLVVGLGAPKQEKWIARYRGRLHNIKIFMALGATIDFEAGNIKRAPRIFQQLSLEWFYRLITEPRRLWRRYLVDDLPIFKYILKQKLGLYKDPFSK